MFPEVFSEPLDEDYLYHADMHRSNVDFNDSRFFSTLGRLSIDSMSSTSSRYSQAANISRKASLKLRKFSTILRTPSPDIVDLGSSYKQIQDDLGSSSVKQISATITKVCVCV